MADEKPFTKLVIENVRCFGKTEVPLHPRVTVVIGENGTGKTTVAEALASMSYGEGEGLAEFPLRHGAKKGRIALYEAGSKKPAAVWAVGAKEERRRLALERWLFAYGRYRRVRFLDDQEIQQDLSADPLARRTLTLTRPDNHLLRDITAALIKLHRRRSFEPAADATWRSLEGSLPVLGHGLDGLEVVELDSSPEVIVVRSGVRLSFAELSDGYQAMLVIVFDLIFRFFALFADLENPLKGKALIVIDEIDLHLHPRWQRRVLSQLSSLFPQVQLVVTTHSPAIVQGAIDQGFLVAVLRETSGLVEALPLDSDATDAMRHAEIGSLLMEDRLFNMPSRYSLLIEAEEREVRMLREKLEKGQASEPDRLRLIEIFDRLELLLAKDEERRGQGPFLSELARSEIAFLRRLDAMAKAKGGK
ncbi:MAG: ATP-binding protein [Thermoanaerobaculia bacterium]|nr:ATP-binding protein [Thermoanaerobaculia bacterium]